MCLTLLEITPLYGRSNQIFFSSFSLPFLYSWRHRIILPILEWLQQRHCYSQGAVSPRCNSIHSQLDWPVIYRKSSPSEELYATHTHTHTHKHTGNSPSAAHDVLGLRSGQFKAASISGKRRTVENHRKPWHQGYGTVVKCKTQTTKACLLQEERF